ncbi:LacI family DNA-binding transcriptional regulator [Neobacillus cucumis]|uniref:LacI family DNA-binding transcriptional regulator n=1 Tax=Neobacillus cucumis TaxID=1740721 RepID=UPI0018DFD29B|nr:LacI family DNA-binding transcriptional regulator [Neobacillus cucumis]MBI0579521.1 LacI family DNA-binding transcriptional regulator [Neobacillus cucumis]
MIGRVTADDVARKAGVSQSTVSRVLNNYPFIKEATREKVLTAISELGFTRDEIARSLVEKKTRSIGLILGDISNPFFAESAGVIIEQAQKLKYDVVICNTNHNDENLEKSINTLIGKRVDGILVASVKRDDTKVQQLHDKGFPIVLYNSSIDDPMANFVVIDNIRGAKMAVEHLLELGHKKIAYIAGPFKYLTTYQRYIGYKEAISENGLTLEQDFVYNGDFSYQKIFEFTKELLTKKNRPTAFLAVSDQMALAILDAATSLNLKIPEDVSVIGFDDISLASNQFIGLTTVSQHMEVMASVALEKLVDLIDHESDAFDPVQIVLKPELKIRKTTAKNLDK